MDQAARARTFAELHRTGEPLVLYNIWDAGSARAVASAGAPALATGSHAVAGAHGFADGQKLPIDIVMFVAQRIVASTELPLSVDFEGGYGSEPHQVAANVARLLATGAIGINFEDGNVDETGLISIRAQSDRIRSIRQVAEKAGIPLFINARTDVFLRERNAAMHGTLKSEALERAAAYREAGASGFFPIMLKDVDVLADICERCAMPVNAFQFDGAAEVSCLAQAGVARISYGSGPWRRSMSAIADAARPLYENLS